MIGSLLYRIASDPDISYSVSTCARYQTYSKESHIATIKRIICYVSGTLDFDLWYSHNINVNLVGFSDAD